MSNEPARRRPETRSTVLGVRLSLALAGVAVVAILLVFFLLDPAQEPAPTLNIAYDQPVVSLDVSPVEATLVADVTAVRPGASFRAGVLLRMQPGWHVFWKDPGEAGLPTHAELRVQSQFTVGPLGWPTPVRFRQPGDLVGFGYADWVLLASTIQAPPELTENREVPLRARVEWLTCEETCEAGEADLELLLSVNDAPHAEREELFASWQRRLPVGADAPDRPVSIVVRREIVGDDSTRYDVEMNWTDTPENLEWFPVADAVLQLHDATTLQTETESRLSFLATRVSDPGDMPVRLETVLAYLDANGVRRSVELPIPLDDSSAPPAGVPTP